MSHSPVANKTLRRLYPPSSAAYPQFVVPFGDSQGHRAAVRLFLGDRKERHIEHDAYDFLKESRRWERSQSFPTPALLSEPNLWLSGVDLDPQVSLLPRKGPSFTIPTFMLLTACSASEFAQEDSTERVFSSRVGSIWGAGVEAELDEASAEATLLSQLERFLDHCQSDLSAQRNIFFAPRRASAALQARAEALQDELDLEVHDREQTIAVLRPLFTQEQGVATNHLCFIDERVEGLKVLLGVLSACWGECYRAVNEEQARQDRELKPGTLLGERYHILSKIGAGGFAIVYEAQDTKVVREVAIKVIDLERNIEDRSRQSYTKRFEREARLAASVRHPCVVEVFDVGVTDDGVHYIVMERLNGWDLEEQMRRNGPMSAARLVPMFIQALEGLGFAHEKDIVHKDLKPSNLFLKNPGKRHEQLCILDFGVARRINTATARLTHTDSAFGTPHYMAPEYSTSQIATPALDVYQMGLILVELLMGDPVVTHPEPVAAMFQHVRGDLHLPQALLDSPLGPIIERALATNHMDRYQDGFEFADALRQVIEELVQIPVLARGAPRVSLKTRSIGDPDSEVRQTPVIGSPTLTTDRYRSSKSLSLPTPPLSPELELERVHQLEISPYASTIPIEDVSSQLASSSSPELRAPHLNTPPAPRVLEPLTPRQDGASEPRDASDSPENSEASGDEVEPRAIVDYSSRAPYILLIVTLLGALGIALTLLWQDELKLKKPPTIPPTEVVTDYDRALAALRERADQLAPRLATGDVEGVISEVAEMDRSSAKLTPDEAERVRKILARARKERPRRAIVDQAMQLIDARQHDLAIDKLDELPADSVFWNHPDTRQIIDRSKIALLPQVQKLRSEGDPKRARLLVEKLLLHDPDNAELRYLLMDVIDDIASQPPALLPVDITPDMGADASSDLDMAAPALAPEDVAAPTEPE